MAQGALLNAYQVQEVTGSLVLMEEFPNHEIEGKPNTHGNLQTSLDLQLYCFKYNYPVKLEGIHMC